MIREAVSTKERTLYITQRLKSQDSGKSGRRHLDYTVVRARLPVCLVMLSSVKLGGLCAEGQAITGVVENGLPAWSQMDVPATQQGKVKIGPEGLLTSRGSPAVTGEVSGGVQISPFFSRTGSSASRILLL